MKRRQFFAAASSMLLPVVVDGFGVKSYAENSALVKSLLQANAINDDRILVMIYLNGGNDGLNTVIPLEYYSAYNSLRSNIAIPESAVLKLSGNLETGLHPSMTGMKEMYDNGKLALIHSASYPNPDLSHTRSTDIWMTGVSSDRYSSSGWAGRYLSDRYQGYPEGYPTSAMGDPLAIQIGQISATCLQGTNAAMQVNVNDPNSLAPVGQISPDFTDLPNNSDSGKLIQYVRRQYEMSVKYSTRIRAASDSGKNIATYPPASADNNLANQLKVAARLIHGGLKSKIYHVELGGFDTHSFQVGTNTTTGLHANLLKKLSDAISAFQKDLQLLEIENKVIGMTFSDFGRRATSNASMGTDHGVGAPMFIFGTGIKRQVLGTNPDLVNGLLPAVPVEWDKSRDIKMQFDFRRVYSDILNDWFGTLPSKTDELLVQNFKTTSLFSDTVQTLASGAWPNPEIWSNGRVPSSKDIVKVNVGHVVEVGQNIVAKKVQVNGELKFLGDYTVSTTG